MCSWPRRATGDRLRDLPGRGGQRADPGRHHRRLARVHVPEQAEGRGRTAQRHLQPRRRPHLRRDRRGTVRAGTRSRRCSTGWSPARPTPPGCRADSGPWSSAAWPRIRASDRQRPSSWPGWPAPPGKGADGLPAGVGVPPTTSRRRTRSSPGTHRRRSRSHASTGRRYRPYRPGQRPAAPPHRRPPRRGWLIAVAAAAVLASVGAGAFVAGKIGLGHGGAPPAPGSTSPAGATSPVTSPATSTATATQPPGAAADGRRLGSYLARSASCRRPSRPRSTACRGARKARRAEKPPSSMPSTPARTS